MASFIEMTYSLIFERLFATGIAALSLLVFAFSFCKEGSKSELNLFPNSAGFTNHFP